MKAIQIREFGEPLVMRLVEVAEPRAGQGEVLVEVKAAGVNYADLLMRRGSYSVRREGSWIPGFEAAGVVLETGAEASQWKPGQRVMGTVLRETCGCYAERAVMPAWLLMPVPDAQSFEEAAAFPEVFITAHLALHVFGRLADGESVLIHAAGGGVGTASVQLAHALGARVFATAGSDEKLRKVKSLGADVLINYRSQDFAEELKKATNGKGVDVILESVGGEVFDKSVRCLSPLGRLVVFGSSSGKASSVAARDLMGGMISVAGFSFGALSVVRTDLIGECMQAAVKLLAQGKVHSVVGHVFPLQEAAAAHELIANRDNFGKVVLVP